MLRVPKARRLLTTSRRVAAVLPLLLPWGAATAQEVEGEIGLHSAYIDVESFNDRFSDEPMVEFVLLIDAGRGFYVEPYVASGFDRPLRDMSSEFGFEAGWSGSVGSGLDLNVAAGRWANYQGAGLDDGDWFGRIGVSRDGLAASVSLLRGASDTILLNAGYEMRVGSRATLTPSVAYVTADNTLNLGAELRYELSTTVAVSGRAAAPETEEGREVYGSFGIIFSFK